MRAVKGLYFHHSLEHSKLVFCFKNRVFLDIKNLYGLKAGVGVASKILNSVIDMERRIIFI